MSFGEILIVIIVGLLVIKPQDIPIIFKKIKQIAMLLNNLKQHLFLYLDQELKIEEQNFATNIEEMNFFLAKIIQLQGEYKGEYSLTQLKTKYQELIALEINKQKNDNRPLS